jgi:hypothetical protein
MMDDDPVAPDLELGAHTVFHGHVRTSVARGGKSGQSN